MSENISVKITLDDKFSSGMKNMTEHIKKFNNEIILLSADLDKLSKKKINIDINSNKFSKEIKDITKEAKGINDAINNLYKRDPKKKLDIHQEIMEIRKQSKHLLNDLKNLESERINIDINMRTSGMPDTDTNSGFSKKSIMSLVGNQIKDTAMDIASLYLPESISNGLNGAIEGAIAGFEFAGPIGAVAGGITSGLGNYASSEQQQKVDKQTQRIQFGSSLIQQYLPQLAMSSINYGSRMEQTKLQLQKTPGVYNSYKMIDSLQEISLKSSLDFFELAEKAQKMLSDQSKKLNQDEVIASLKAMEQEATTFDILISNIKEGASQLILGPLGSGFISGIKPALEKFAEFFGMGTEGFDDLKNSMIVFGYKMGNFLGSVITEIRNTLGGLFERTDFKEASVPEKFLIVLKELKGKAESWYNTDGQLLIASIKGFFTNLFVDLGKDSDFNKAVQDLWLTISPDDETIKKIIGKCMGLEDEKIIPKEYYSIFNSSSFNPHNAFTDIWKNSPNPHNGYTNFLGNSPNNGNTNNTENQTQILKGNHNAFGLDRVPYDGYRAVLHEGERVLTRVQADNQTGSISINKIADTVIVREESDIDKITHNLIAKLESYRLAYGGVM